MKKSIILFTEVQRWIDGELPNTPTLKITFYKITFRLDNASIMHCKVLLEVL